MHDLETDKELTDAILQWQIQQTVQSNVAQQSNAEDDLYDF